MAAVTQDSRAFQYAGPEAKNDHAIVMAVVAQYWGALQFASPEARNDREIMRAALTQSSNALSVAGSSLLEDKAFALEFRASFIRFYLIKVVTLFGTACVVAVYGQHSPLHGSSWEQVMRGIEMQLGRAIDEQSAILLWGTEEVPKRAACSEWPGSPQLGQVCEYQLVIITGHADS
eukprot:5808806-Amphidinium_carterae.1